MFKAMVICFTVAVVVLPVAFLVALSLPRASEFRRLVLQLCYWGVALAAVSYFAMPLDVVPDMLFPVGFADDLIALGLGLVAARKAVTPAIHSSCH
jgi:uncharacterized membrane protein YkvA (DUF1232 family)